MNIVNWITTGISVLGILLILTPPIYLWRYLRKKYHGFPFKLLIPKRNQRPWGIVYDVKTYKPVPFTFIGIFHKDGKLIKSTVSDIEGRYGFSLDQGIYHIKTENYNYGVYENDILVIGSDKQHTRDIGLFPCEKTDRLTSKSINTLKELYFASIIIISIPGFIINLIAVMTGFNLINFTALFAYQAIFIITYLYHTPRNWGKVYNLQDGNDMGGVFVRAYDKFQGRQVDVQITDSKGRFGFKLRAGEYFLKFDIKEFTLRESDLAIEKLINGEKAIRVRAEQVGGLKIGLGKDSFSIAR